MIEFCGNQIKTINNNNSLIVKSCAPIPDRRMSFQMSSLRFGKCSNHLLQVWRSKSAMSSTTSAQLSNWRWRCRSGSSLKNVKPLSLQDCYLFPKTFVFLLIRFFRFVLWFVEWYQVSYTFHLCDQVTVLDVRTLQLIFSCDI